MTKRDLNYAETGLKHHLKLDPFSKTPDILKRGITLMLFSDDPDIRNFNGTSVVNAFPTVAQSGFSGIDFYLALAAKRIQAILASMYPNIEQVYFSLKDDAPTLSVQLNISTTDGDILTAVIYE